MKNTYSFFRPTLAKLILVLMVAFIAFSATRLLIFALSGETNADLVSDILNPCEAAPIAPHPKMAILRLDDVQAYAWADVSIRMMDDAKARGVPLVLGVIPKGLRDDTRVYTYLRENRCFHEIAQHGWDHNSETDGESPEFRGASYESALPEIQAGKDILEQLAREKITTFIPPNNEMSVETYRVMEKLSIPVVSSEGSEHFDFHATSFDYTRDVKQTTNDIVHDCEERTATADLCVVMLHPQEFAKDGAVDPDAYQTYLDTIDQLRARGYTFVRFKDLVEFDREYSSWERYVLPSFLGFL